MLPMNFSYAINKALEIFFTWFGVMLVFTWSKILLSLWIEGNHKAFTISGKVLSFIFCFFGSLIVSVILGWMLKSSTTGLIIFFITISCSLAAAFLNYKIYKDSL